jgi:hypothetical protein
MAGRGFLECGVADTPHRDRGPTMPFGETDMSAGRTKSAGIRPSTGSMWRRLG